MLSFLMIGYGTMGAVHASKIKESGKLGQLFVVDINSKSLDAAKKHGYLAFPDLKSAYRYLEEQGGQEFDVLVITSNTATHYQYLEQTRQRCLKNGSLMPAVFVEKPIVANAQEAYKLKSDLENTKLIENLIFMCGYLLRESPAVAHMIQKIKNADDCIKEINIVWQKRREPKRPSAGVVQDETTHSLDLVQYVMCELGMDINYQNLEILSSVRTTEIVDLEAQNVLYPEGDKNRNPIAEIKYKLQLGKTQINGRSSFLIAPQERTIEFVSEKATYRLEFDKNKADWCDGLPFPNDKISSLWDSFLQMISAGKPLKRVTNFDQAIADVVLTDSLEAKADEYLEMQQKAQNVLFAFSASKNTVSTESAETANENYCGFKRGFLL